MALHRDLVARIHDVQRQYPHALITMYDSRVKCVYASPNHIESGWTDQDMLGSHWSRFIIVGDEPHGALAWEDAVLHDESAQITVTGLTKYGERLRMKVRGWRLVDPDTQEPFMLVRSILLEKPTPRHNLQDIP